MGTLFSCFGGEANGILSGEGKLRYVEVFDEMFLLSLPLALWQMLCSSLQISLSRRMDFNLPFPWQINSFEGMVCRSGCGVSSCFGTGSLNYMMEDDLMNYPGREV